MNLNYLKKVLKLICHQLESQSGIDKLASYHYVLKRSNKRHTLMISICTTSQDLCV